MSTKSTKEKNAAIAEFRNVTGAEQADAVKYLKKHNYRLDAAVDAYFSDPNAAANSQGAKDAVASATQRLTILFDKYKEPGTDSITVEGTMKLCEELAVELDDVVLIALAYELKAPNVGEWTKKGWLDGWKTLKCDSIPSMKAILPQLRSKLTTDAEYFRSVYLHTFDYAKSEGQRSIPVDTAKAFWQLLLPVGLRGAALAHSTEGEDGWKSEYTDWWYEFLDGKGLKGVSRDTWNMFIDFIRTIDARFEKHDSDAAWPSVIDDFVEDSKEKIQKNG